MIFAVTCPQCSARCKLPADVAGKKLQCPKCQETFVVSANDIEEIPDMTKSAPPATQPPMNSPRVEEDRPRRRPIDEDDDYEAPRPRHTKVAKTNPTVLYGAIGGGILGVGLLVFSIVYFTRDKKKESSANNARQEVAANNNADPDLSRPPVNKQVDFGKGKDIPNVGPRPPIGIVPGSPVGPGPTEEPKGPPMNVPPVGPGPTPMGGMQEGPPTVPPKETNPEIPGPSNELPKGIGPQGPRGEDPIPKKEVPGGGKEGPFGPPKGGFPGGGQQFFPKNGPVAKVVGSVPIQEMVKDLLYSAYATVAVDLEEVRKNQIPKLIADDMMKDGGLKTLLMLQRAGFKDADFSKIVYQANAPSNTDVPLMAAVRFTDSIDQEKMVMGLQASEKKLANAVYYVAVDGSAFFFPSDDTVVIAPEGFADSNSSGWEKA